MPAAIIKVDNLSKQYRIGTREQPAYGTLRDALTNVARSRFGLKNGPSVDRSRQMIWALRNVSFEVKTGDVVGIIGSNGAGKSTLLKILSRITQPTCGRAELYGRVGSLLEVGTGFHPELSGRENIFLNGALLGMRRAEILRKFDEIVAFSEVERFIDTPVKFYSSGMYMRLAFSVAAHLESEILMVDEVLAVGDIAFQKKCLGKIGKVAEGGRTVLFVSHNMVAVQKLCSRVLWLDHGTVVQHGRAADVISEYSKTSSSAIAEQTWDDRDAAPGNEQVQIRRASVHPAGGTASGPIDVHTPVDVEFEYWNLVPDAYLNVSVVVCAEDGSPIFNTGSGTDRLWHGRPFPPGLFRSSFRIPGDLLNDGKHRVHLYIVRNQSEVVFRLDDALVFNVEESTRARSAWYGKWIGAVRPHLQWKTEKVGGITTVKAAIDG